MDASKPKPKGTFTNPDLTERVDDLERRIADIEILERSRNPTYLPVKNKINENEEPT